MNILATIPLIILVVFLVIKRSEVLALTAKRKFGKNDLKGAIKRFALANRIGKLGPESKRFYGYLLLRDGQLDMARVILNQGSIAAKKPEVKKRIKTMLAIVEWKSGDLPLAIEMTEEAMVDFKTSNLYQNLGVMYNLSGNPKKALEFNKEAYEFNPDDLIILDNLAESYVLCGEVKRASELYEELLEKEPIFPEPYCGYAKLLIKQGEKGRAIKLLEQSLNKRFSFLSIMQKSEVEKLIAETKGE